MKVGDKVRYVGNGFDELRGGTYEIRNIEGNIVTIKTPYLEAPYFNLLIKDVQPIETELERFVRIANEGREAENYLKVIYADQIKINITTVNGKLCPIEIKSKVRKFKVASWDAEINSDMVTIGCQKFNKAYLIQDLKDILNGDCSISEQYGLRAYRDCIGYKPKESLTPTRGPQNPITWDQAEQLLKELETA